MKLSHLLCLFIIVFSLQIQAKNPAIFEITANKTMENTYSDMQISMNDSRFFVIKELDLGKSLARFSEDWGDNYNQNKLTSIRTMIFCNGWYANKISNEDPKMLSLCPLHLTLIEKDGKTTALFNRPTTLAKGSPAFKTVLEIENDVIKIIKSGME